MLSLLSPLEPFWLFKHDLNETIDVLVLVKVLKDKGDDMFLKIVD